MNIMSIKRDKARDRSTTREVLRETRPLLEGRKNWLGHTKGAAQIDEMLIKGATKFQMSAARDAVEEHLYHLRTEHGLPLIEAGGVWTFNRVALKV
jgi:hypothetical protein